MPRSIDTSEIVIGPGGLTVTAYGKTYKAIKGNGWSFKACNGCAFLGLKKENQKQMQDLCLATECTEVEGIVGAIYVEVIQ